jgi:hypothetical protein
MLQRNLVFIYKLFLEPFELDFKKVFIKDKINSINFNIIAVTIIIQESSWYSTKEDNIITIINKEVVITDSPSTIIVSITESNYYKDNPTYY